MLKQTINLGLACIPAPAWPRLEPWPTSDSRFFNACPSSPYGAQLCAHAVLTAPYSHLDRHFGQRPTFCINFLIGSTHMVVVTLLGD